MKKVRAMTNSERSTHYHKEYVRAKLITLTGQSAKIYNLTGAIQ